MTDFGGDKALADLDRLIQEQIGLIERAIQKIILNDLMNVSALNGAVDTICAQAAKLDPDQMQQIEGRMAEMIGKLETFAAELEAFQQRAQNQGGNGTH